MPVSAFQNLVGADSEETFLPFLSNPLLKSSCFSLSWQTGKTFSQLRRRSSPPPVRPPPSPSAWNALVPNNSRHTASVSPEPPPPSAQPLSYSELAGAVAQAENATLQSASGYSLGKTAGENENCVFQEKEWGRAKLVGLINER